MIFNTIKSVSFDKNEDRIFGIKSGIVWGHRKKTGALFPLLYISKPKHISENDFKTLLSTITISFNFTQQPLSEIETTDEP